MRYDLPRYVGNPYQYYLTKPEEFIKFVHDNNGRWPCFTSHNAHPRPGIIKLRYIPWDYDNAEKPENALHDVLKFRDRCQDEGLNYVVAWSGNKGFHSYMEFRPQLVKDNIALKRMYRAVQETYVLSLDLRTADDRIIGDTRRLMRIVNTQHPESGLYCVEIPDDLLDDADINSIIDYASQPRPTPNRPRPSETFSEAMERLDFEPGMGIRNGSGVETVPYRDSTPEFVKALLPRPCIHSDMMSTNPKHMTRFEACNTLVKLGYGLEWLLEFFDEVAEMAKWVDRHHKHIRDYQVRYLWQQRGRYDPHSCHTLRENGLCIGAKCPLFERVWPDEYAVLEETTDEKIELKAVRA